ncbi:MAG: hypothetical protein JSW52_04210, partial [Candidatus Coatesbacteria bacterium]
VTVLAAIGFFTATAASGYLHLEDFESFDDGDDIATSPDWTNWTPSNEICCYEFVRDKAASPYTSEDTECFYLWEASDSALDYGVFTDFMALDATSDETIGVCARMNGEYPTDYEVYFAVCRPFADSGYWSFVGLGYKNEDGMVVLAEEYYTFTIVDSFEWHEIGFQVYGDGPVYFDVYLDGESQITHTEDEHVISAGHGGLYYHFIEEEEIICFDNVTQEEADTSITPASLGEVKATFR